MSGYARGIVAFLVGLLLSYLVSTFLNSAGAGVFTAVCFFGALIYAEICEHNQRCEKQSSSKSPVSRINKRNETDSK